MAKAGVEMIAARPLLGVGPDVIPQRYPIYREPTAPRFWVPHLHANLLQIAAERGLPALVLALPFYVGAGEEAGEAREPP
jgi:O-antigen ligase